MRSVKDTLNEIPKHIKNKESSKSKHKHKYIERLLIYEGNPHKAKYCNICGKLTNVMFGETEKYERDGKIYYRTLSNDEVFERYKNIEHIEVDNIWNRYVPISKGE